MGFATSSPFDLVTEPFELLGPEGHKSVVVASQVLVREAELVDIPSAPNEAVAAFGDGQGVVPSALDVPAGHVLQTVDKLREAD